MSVPVAAWAIAAVALDLTGTAQRKRLDGPGVRNAHGLAFDGRASVLFGGASDREVLADTWGWNGRTWRRFDLAGPPARTFPVAVSAPGQGVFLFGGRRVLFGATFEVSQLLGDLWQWTGSVWTAIPGSGPSPRAEAAGAWDPLRARLVIVGGYTARDGAVEALGDTWEFGDGTWRQFTGKDGPSPRYGALAAYDATVGEVVLFGGNGGLGDTWSWNGTRWRQLGAGPAPGRYNAAGAGGPEAMPVLRFGGWDGQRRRQDAWALRAGGWRPAFRAGGPSPSARNHAAMTFDVRRQRFVLVGGHDGQRVFGDVWETDAGNGWQRVFFQAARQRIDNQH